MAELQYVPKYGWDSYVDGEGYTYWIDREDKLPSTYDMPCYSVEQYRALLALQKRARKLLAALSLRRKLKAEARLKDIARMEAVWEDSGSSLGSRAVKISLNLFNRKLSNRLSVVSTSATSRVDDDGIQTNPSKSMEQFLPSRLRLKQMTSLVSGCWALLSGDNNKYEIVMLCRVRENGTVCDVKHVTGQKVVNVQNTKIFEMNIEQGSEIEARHRGNLDFYRGRVALITTAFDGSYRYSILYQDGEKETNVTRDMIRFANFSLNLLLKERYHRLALLEKQQQRELFYAGLKNERTLRDNEIVDEATRMLSVCLHPKTQGQGHGGSFSKDAMAKKLAASVAAAAAATKAKGVKGRGGSVLGVSNIVATTSSFPDGDLRNLLTASQTLTQMAREVSISIVYIRAIRFGWRMDHVKGDIIYHKIDNTEGDSDTPPRYTAAEDFAARKIQSLIRMRLSRLRFQKLVYKDTLTSIINRAVLKAKRTAFIGFENEGVTTYQLLRRLGFCDLADNVEAAVKKKPSLSVGLSVERITALTLKDQADFGITTKKTELQHDLTKLQNWWARAAPIDRDAAMSFVNYYDSSDDDRSLKECMLASEETIVMKFLGAFPAQEARTRAACKRIVGSLYPHGFHQIDAFISKYQNSPELARVSR